MIRFSPQYFSRLSALLCLLAAPADAALTITLDFTHDDASGTPFWSGNVGATERRGALQAAVDDINALLSPTTLGNISSDPISATVVGSSGNTTATLDPTISYTNPTTGDSVSITDLTTFGSDEFRLFVGARDLNGDDATVLAQGGRAGVGLGIGGSGYASDWVEAVGDAEAEFNTQIGRGGPIMTTLSGTATLGSTTASYDLDFGLTAGNLWFDSDTNNDGVTDSPTLLDSFWHSDHEASVTAGQYDVYTVALHEILHSIGYANSNNAFSGNVTGGTDWTGAAVIGLLGTGDDLLNPGSTSHINSAITSTVFGGGAAQSPVMLASISAGDRRFITDLDAAVLSDMGFSVIPEITSMPVFGAILFVAAIGRRRRSAL